MKNKLISTKNYVVRNKTELLIAALATTTAVAAIQHFGIKSLNEFLKENNLYDAYYTMTDEI